MLKDWKITARKFRKSVGSSLTTVVVLGVAVGANAAIYALADNYLIGSYSSRHDDVYLVGAAPRDPEQDYFYRFRNSLLEPLEEALNSYRALCRVGTYAFTLSNIDRPLRLHGMRVGAGAQEVLNIEAVRGRALRDFDFEPDAEKSVMLAYHIWVSAFGSDEGAVGKRVNINGVSHRIIGVLPDDFTFKQTVFDVLSPSSFKEPVFLGASFNVWLAGLLKEGVTPAQAVAEVKALEGRFADLVPPRYFENNTLDVKHINERSHSLVQTQINLLLSTGLILLIIAAANLCSFALVQLNRRRTEYATRVALGAGRKDIMRLFAMENGALVLGGYLAAVLFGFALIQVVLTQFSGADWGLLAMLGSDIHLNWRILAVTLAACVAVLILLSLTTLALGSSDLLAAFLKEEGRGLSEGRTFKNVGHFLRFLQIAATCAALVIGGFFLVSLDRISGYDYGYEFENIVRTDVRLPGYSFLAEDGSLLPDTISRLHGLMDSVVDAVRRVPGVTEAAMSKLEFPHWGEMRGVRLPDTPPDLPDEDLPQSKEGFAGPGFFDLVGMHVIRGESISEFHNRDDSEPVMVVNEAFVRRYFRGDDPLDQFVEARGQRFRVVGVVSNVRRWQHEEGELHGLPLQDQTEPGYYLSNRYDNAVSFGYLYLKAPAFGSQVEHQIRQAVLQVNSDIVVGNFGMLRALLGQRENTYRLIVFVQVLLAGIGALLACVAIFSAVSQAVTQRRFEMGIRLALGATPGDIQRGILRYTLFLVVPGVLTGLAASYIGLVYLGLLESQLHLVNVTDARVYLVCCLGLLAVGLLAGLQPARKAGSLTPTEVLRGA